MAIVLKLKQGDSGTELNLQSSPSTGFQLAGDGWSPNVATTPYLLDAAAVVETIRLRLRHTSQDSIASSMQSLHEMQRLANEYIEDARSYSKPVWLHAKLANETGERRALVRSISIQFESSWFGTAMTALDIPLILVVAREPYWESTTARDLPDYANPAGVKFSYDYTAAGASVSAHDIVGDVGARIRHFDVYNLQYEWMHNIWMGTRSANKHGSTGLTNFVQLWECESGTNEYSDVTDFADADASGGYCVRINESAWEWDNLSFYRDVSILKLSDFTSNYADQFGNFLWLLRATCSGASTTWQVSIEFSYSSNYSQIPSQVIEVTSNDFYRWHEVGVVPIGLLDRRSLLIGDAAASWEQNYKVYIKARRTSGTADLYLDCLMPVPVDEGFIKISSPEGGGFQFNHMKMGRSPDGVAVAMQGVNNGLAIIDSMMNVYSDVNFNLPPGDGRIMGTMDGTGIDIASTITFNDADVGKYYERWSSLRGSE